MFDEVYASVDLGSNTFRLLVAEADGNGRMITSSKKVFQEIPRLSEGLVPGQPLGREARRRAFDAMQKFHEILLVERPIGVLAGATMAVRLASDGEEFLKEIVDRWGWETKLLSGPVEAYLSASGVINELESYPESAIIFDIGGRSTEFVNFFDHTIMKTKSLDMGVVGLTEAHVFSDPPTDLELLRVEENVQRLLQGADWSAWKTDSLLIGTAGTVTTIAAMLLRLSDYSPKAVSNLDIAEPVIRDLLNRIKTLPLEERKTLAGLHPGRADVIVAGIIAVLEIMGFFQQKSILVSDAGLLEGLWLLVIGMIPLELEAPPSSAPNGEE